jgi:hypothetical protein
MQIPRRKYSSKWTSLGLLLLFSTQTFLQLLFVIYFHIHRPYFAKNVCVMKKVENNCCQGSCVLKKSWNPRASTNSNAVIIKQWIPEIELISMYFSPLTFSKPHLIEKFDNSTLCNGFEERPLKPPTAS